MTENLKKLIADNKWQSIENAPRDGVFIARDYGGKSIFCEWWPPDNSWMNWVTSYKCYPRTWRPLPDDRLADIALELLECVEEWLRAAEDLLNEEGGGEHGRGMKTCAGFLKESLNETLNKVNKIMESE